MGVITQGKPGKDFALIRKAIGDYDPEVIALLTMKVALDVLGQLDREKGEQPLYVKICSSIGHSIQTELRLSWYRQQDKDLFRLVEKGFHKSTGTRQKATVFKLTFNREGIAWDTWSKPTNLSVGAWAFDCLQHATQWFLVEDVKAGEKKQKKIVRFHKDFLKLREAIMERAMELATLNWPMVCEPIPWANDAVGGYLTGQERNHRMVRAFGGGSIVEQGELFIQMLNRLQEQKYRLNRKVYEVAEYCFQNFISVGKFKREERKEPPSRPGEGASEEAIQEYKRLRKRIEDSNAYLERDNWRTTETMFVCRKFVDEPAIWIPWSADYRGRLYPLTTSLTPQGTDFDKSLFYFADEGPVNEYWLAFQVATTYGLDKATMTDRVEWTRANKELISTIAQNPLDTISEWRKAEEPWCFLASCFEYFDCCIACTRETSGLPVGIDATCSGLQHLSAMTGDRKAASLVNVTPTDKPADGYKTVAERAAKYLEAEYHPFLTRKVTKRTVMTTPYGVSRHSARGYIREALKEAGCDLKEAGLLTKFTTAIYDHAMRDVFAGPVRVMEWIQESAVRIIRQGAEYIQWTTPSGFVVQQYSNKPKTKQVQTQLMGAGKIAPRCYLGPGPIDIDGHKSCTAPNLVHSLDASLLHFAFSEWDKPFTVIHDCALGRSCDMDEMGKEIRLHFAEMYKGGVLEDWAAQVGAFIPDGLIKGDLDIDEVNQSTYFFC
jgi:DNA-directed RNA polymerase